MIAKTIVRSTQKNTHWLLYTLAVLYPNHDLPIDYYQYEKQTTYNTVSAISGRTLSAIAWNIGRPSILNASNPPPPLNIPTTHLPHPLQPSQTFFLHHTFPAGFVYKIGLSLNHFLSIQFTLIVEQLILERKTSGLSTLAIPAPILYHHHHPNPKFFFFYLPNV
jgi:hypothetical protein